MDNAPSYFKISLAATVVGKTTHHKVGMVRKMKTKTAQQPLFPPKDYSYRKKNQLVSILHLEMLSIHKIHAN